MSDVVAAMAVEVARSMLAMAGTDNTALHAAEETIKQFLTRPQAALVLVQLIANSPDALVRQLSAVLLRRKVLALYNRCSPEQREELKTLLITRMASESERLVRKAVVCVVAALGRALLPGHNWPQLETVLVQCATHPTDDVRELGMVLLRELSEGIGPRMQEFAAALRPMYVSLLSDASLPVRVAALNSLSHMLHCLNEAGDFSGYGEFIPVILHLVREFCIHDHGGVATETLDIICSLAHECSPVLKPHLDVLIRTCLMIACAKEAAEHIRCSAVQVLMDVVCTRPKQVMKLGLVVPLLDAGMTLCLERDPDEEHEKHREAEEAGIELAEFSDDSTANMGSRLVDSLCQNQPAAKMYGPVVERVQLWLTRPEWQYRAAAMVVFATSIQGLRTALNDRLDSVLALIGKLAADPSAYVRETVVWALAQLAEYTLPFLHNWIHIFIPMALGFLEDGNDYVAANAATAVENFVEALEQVQVRPYVELLVTKLMQAAGRPSQVTWMKPALLGALASTAAASGELLSPWTTHVMALLSPALRATDARMIELRSNAMECLGHVALAVGKEQFRPYLKDAVDCALQGLDIESNALLENTYVFFGNVANADPEQILPYVPELLKLMTMTIASTEGIDHIVPDRQDSALAARLTALTSKDADEEASSSVHASAAGDAAAEDSDDSDEGAGTRTTYRIYTSAINAKCAAFLCMGKFAKAFGAAFAAHVPTLLPFLERGLVYVDERIRADAALSYASVVESLFRAYPPIPAAEPGGAVILQPNTQTIYNFMITQFVEVMRMDTDLEVVARVCAGIQSFCVTLGLAAVVNHHEAIMGALQKLLREKAPCQLAAEEQRGETADGEDGENDEDAEHDYVLMDEVADAVIAVAGAMGPLFAHYLPGTIKLVQKFTKPARPTNDKSMAIGLYGDLAGRLGDVFAPMVPSVVEVVATALQAEHRDIRRNAAFATGMLLHSCTAAARPYAPQLLARLQPLLALPRGGTEDDEACVDNAASALARAIVSVPDLVPSDVAVPAMMRVLPLRADVGEWPSVFEALFRLLMTGAPAALSNLPHVITLLSWSLSAESNVPDVTRAGVVLPGLRALLTAAPAPVAAAVSTALQAAAPAQRDLLLAAVRV